MIKRKGSISPFSFYLQTMQKIVNQKQRGNRFERYVVNQLKKIGFSEAATSRLMSKQMDNLGIDIVGVPYLIQCKYGKQKGIKYSEVIKNISDNTQKMKELNQLPIIIFHTTDGRKEENKLIIMREKDLWKLLKTEHSIT